MSLLVLPELCTTGYGCEDAFLGPDVAKRAWSMLMELVPQTKGMVVSIGMPVRRRGGLYNTACVVADGRIAGFAAKEHLAGEGLHYEPRWFKPWPNHQVVQLERDGQSYPFGDVFFDFSGVRIGFEICEDAWVAQRRGGQDGHAMDIIVNPSASHFAFGKHLVRERLVLEGSRSMAVTYLYANLLGNEAGRVIYDGGCYIAQNGKLLAQSPRLTFDDSVLTTAVVDVEASRTEQVRTTSFQADSTDPGAKRTSVDFEFPRATMERTEPSTPPWESSEQHKEEELMRSLTLALFDYLRKSHSRGFVLSISGGADSAAAACLVSLMVDRALEALGPERFAEKVGLAPEPSARDWVRKLLCCAYQPTDNSTDVTRDAATAVAEALGATFYILDVQHIVDAYEHLIGGAVGRPLTWDRDDITLQNIQARARGPSVWMLANMRGALLLSTSNRSEAAVGYATMDGDTCGGLSPIAGIDKAFLRHWLRWLETTGPRRHAADPCAPCGERADAHRRAPPQGQRPNRRRRPDALPRARRHRATGHRGQAPARRLPGNSDDRVLRARRGNAPLLGEALLPTLVTQPVETGAIRPVVPRRRQEPRPENLVPLSDLVGRLRARAIRALSGPSGPCARFPRARFPDVPSS